jgi:hypothetical protein
VAFWRYGIMALWHYGILPFFHYLYAFAKNGFIAFVVVNLKTFFTFSIKIKKSLLLLLFEYKNLLKNELIV